jgi:lysozyme
MTAASNDQAIELAAGLCRQFEGLRLKPYPCPAGIPTIGYGSTRYADGRAVTLKDAPVTAVQADELLRLTLRRDYLPGVLRLSPILADKPRALAAIVDFAYNLGVSKYAGSTLRRRIDAGDWSGARTELAKWVRGGGQVLPGLVKRRAAEAALLPV